MAKGKGLLSLKTWPRPSWTDTYVWCKAMADWEKAGDVADICRHFRRTVYDRTHGTPLTPQASSAEDLQTTAPAAEDPYAEIPLRFRDMVRRSGEEANMSPEEEADINRAPPTPYSYH